MILLVLGLVLCALAALALAVGLDHYRRRVVELIAYSDALDRRIVEGIAARVKVEREAALDRQYATVREGNLRDSLDATRQALDKELDRKAMLREVMES